MDKSKLIFGIYVDDEKGEGPEFVFGGRSKSDCYSSTVAALVMLMCADDEFKHVMAAGMKAYLDERDNLEAALQGKHREIIINASKEKS